MTTEANGQAETPTTAPSVTAITGQGSTGEVGISLAGPLSEDNRGAIEAKGWMKDGKLDVEKLASSYRSLEGEYSKSVRMPGEGATADDWNAFYAKLGRPEKADNYELKLDASSLPEKFPYDEKTAIEFRTWAHEAGLNPKQAQQLHDKFVGHQAGSFSAMMEAGQQKAAAAHAALAAKWGGAESEGYKTNVELMSRAAQQLGLVNAFKANGLIGADGSILNEDIAVALAKVGKELYAEDTMMTTASGALNNPWSEGKENRTEQSVILRNDPSKAKALIRAAGHDPARWGL
jgi:hypothetical protein